MTDRLALDGDGAHGIAVQHHDARVGIGREQRVEREQVAGRLERPPARCVRLQHLEREPVVVVRGLHVAGVEPLDVRRDAEEAVPVLGPERLGEERHALGRPVAGLPVHRLQLRAPSSRSLPASRPRPRCAGRSVNVAVSGGGIAFRPSHFMSGRLAGVAREQLAEQRRARPQHADDDERCGGSARRAPRDASRTQSTTLQPVHEPLVDPGPQDHPADVVERPPRARRRRAARRGPRARPGHRGRRARSRPSPCSRPRRR